MSECGLDGRTWDYLIMNDGDEGEAVFTALCQNAKKKIGSGSG